MEAESVEAEQRCGPGLIVAVSVFFRHDPPSSVVHHVERKADIHFVARESLFPIKTESFDDLLDSVVTFFEHDLHLVSAIDQDDSKDHDSHQSSKDAREVTVSLDVEALLLAEDVYVQCSRESIRKGALFLVLTNHLRLI